MISVFDNYSDFNRRYSRTSSSSRSCSPSCGEPEDDMRGVAEPEEEERVEVLDLAWSVEKLSLDSMAQY